MGVEVKRVQSFLKVWMAEGVSLKGELEGLVRAVRGTAVALKPQINRLLKLANPRSVRPA